MVTQIHSQKLLKRNLTVSKKFREKNECVGHVQKRVGSRLRKPKDKTKDKLEYGKGFGGRSRLAKNAIDKLLNAMGMAIRQNVGSLYAMKKNFCALLYHYSEAKDPDTRHQFCPRGIDSWCKYQTNLSNILEPYEPSLTLPISIRDLIKPIFIDLSSDELLSKCLHGRTQNANESLNQVIWKRCPQPCAPNSRPV